MPKKSQRYSYLTFERILGTHKKWNYAQRFETSKYTHQRVIVQTF